MAAQRGIRYIPAIDGLRAGAVIAVMLYHLGVSWIPGGFLGVDRFFVIYVRAADVLSVTAEVLRQRRKGLRDRPSPAA